MGSQLVCTLKYGVLAAIAFVGPQLITNSGNFLGNVERKIELENQTPILTPAELVSSTSSGAAKTDLPAKVQTRRQPQTLRKPNLALPDNRETNFPWNPIPESQENSDTTHFAQTESYPASSATPLEEIIRFDRYPAWIVERWPRVDTVQAEKPLYGYRVAVLTGNQADDLTGVLTYYYDNTQMQKIVFLGQTGDYRKIVRFLQYRFGMNIDKDSSSREMTWHTAPPFPGSSHHVSHLVVRPVQSFDSRRKGDFFEVAFELNRP